mgnify:CR=1 FL=1
MKSILHYLNPKLYHPDSVLDWFTHRAGKGHVISGPFTGLAYVGAAAGSAYVPKVLGTYEKELHAIIRQVQEKHFDSIVGIGAAEGYYAVGLAVSANGNARVLAYETEEPGRRLLAEMASLNRVTGQIEIAGQCEPVDLERALAAATGKKFVLCDTEGYELHLLDLEVVPSLGTAYILVELHEFVHRGITEIMRKRFARTHDIEEVFSVARDRQDYPIKNWYTRLCPHKYILKAMQEYRPEQMNWFWMQPKPPVAPWRKGRS